MSLHGMDTDDTRYFYGIKDLSKEEETVLCEIYKLDVKRSTDCYNRLEKLKEAKRLKAFLKSLR